MPNSDPSIESSRLYQANGVTRYLIGRPITADEIVTELTDFNAHGFRSSCPAGGYAGDTEHEELRKVLRQQIISGADTLRQLAGWFSSFEPCHRWKHNSYSLKHTFERETGKYVMNGLFIVAVIKAGFEIKRDGPDASLKMRRPAL